MEERRFEPVDRCALCGSTEQHPVKGVSWKGEAFSYSICSCGLKYMNPRPTPASMIRYFTDDYWQQNLAGDGFPSVAEYSDKRVDQMKLRMPKYERNYQRIKQHLTEVVELSSNTRVLEVGCAFGYTLEWLHRDFGCTVHAIEPSKEAQRRIAEVPAIEVVGSTAEELFTKRSDRPYDVILFRHCLEQITEPRAVLDGVHAHLKDTGILLIYTANLEYHDAMSPFAPYVYSRETIARLLALSGLHVFRLDASPSPTDRTTALKSKPFYEMAVFARRGERRKVDHPKIDVHALQRSIALGNARAVWDQLSARDLFLLLSQKVRTRLADRRSNHRR